MGRKPSEDPSTVISVRLSADELGELDELQQFLETSSRSNTIKLAIKMTAYASKRAKEKKNANP